MGLVIIGGLVKKLLPVGVKLMPKIIELRATDRWVQKATDSIGGIFFASEIRI